MNFHHWTTLSSEMKKEMSKKVRKWTDQQIYDYDKDAINRAAFSRESIRVKRLIRLETEFKWNKIGKPYYNVHPEMVKKLVKTNLDAIPSTMIEMPNNLEVVHFRFAEDVPENILDELTARNIHQKILSDSKINTLYMRSVLFARIDANAFSHKEMKEIFVKEEIDRIEKAKSEKIPSPAFIILLDEGFRVMNDEHKRTLYNSIVVLCDENKSIPEIIQASIDNRERDVERIMLMTMQERVKKLFKVICTIGFMANCDEDNLITHDILTADEMKFKEAKSKNDKEKIKQIIDRAKRKGHYGYNVGTSEIFVDAERDPISRNIGQEGKQLTFAHIRTGHPHAVRYGKNRSKIKIKWFKPSIIRPDLPFKTENS